MFKLRVITSLILLPLVIYFILKSNLDAFVTLSVALFLLAGYEWSHLINLQSLVSRSFFLVLLLITFIASSSLDAKPILYTGLFWWVLSFIWIVFYPRAVSTWNRSLILIILGIEVLLPSWLALVYLREYYGAPIVLYLLGLVWAADTGAYLVGRLWGRRKLAPRVSPGKTVEGVVGGLVFSFIIGLVGAYYFQIPISNQWLWLVLAIFTCLISIVGDLLVSMMKRNRGVKDSGRLLPGHGGLLDRIDSLTAAAPLFALVLIYTSKTFFSLGV